MPTSPRATDGPSAEVELGTLAGPRAGADAARRPARLPIGGKADGAVRLAPALFALALFVNAALLFTLEPMFTKMVLPLLGGTPSVWTTALLFFQAALLGGYLYAHVAAGRLPPRAQGALHLALVAVASLALPVALPRGWQPPAAGSPVPWLLLVLALSLGAPFFVLAAGAPLLQRWYVRTGHPSAADPYVLYAASNAGSLAALLAYPTLLEPHLRLGEQSRAWAVAYGALALLLVGCAVLGARGAAARPALAPMARVAERGRPDAALRARWTLLSFVPSSLLLGTTAYLSTDVAAVPLLWVIPLALYLLSFVVVFAREPVVPHLLAVRLEALVIAPLAVLMLVSATRPFWLVGGYHLLALFLVSLVCHGELARRRPPPEWLTDFYLWMSVGGVLGGVFNVLVAPHVFDSVVEYPLVLVLACLLRPAAPPPGEGRPPPDRVRRRALDVALPLAVFGAVVALVRSGLVPISLVDRRGSVAWGLLGVAVFLFRGRPVRFALGVAALLVGGAVAWRVTDGPPLFRGRSFFGVYTVRADGYYHMLSNGTTLHGGQLTRDQWRREPLTYYHRGGPVGQLFATLPPLDRGRRVAAVGLGAGTLACYARPGDAWTFYEIDPLAVRIARDPRLFTYLQDCAPGARVVLGDARLSIAHAPARAFDLIFLDAFTSDAIPVHLLTREALALYLSKLEAGGLIAVHVSNRHLDLVPVLSELAREARIAGAVGSDANFTDAERKTLKNYSTWVVLARSPGDFAALVRRPGWAPLPPRANVRPWTDDASDLISVFRWK